MLKFSLCTVCQPRIPTLNKHTITKQALCSYAFQEELTSRGTLNSTEAADGHPLVALLKTCAKQKDLSKGIRLHADIARREVLEKNVFVGTSLVTMYAKCGALAKAQETFNELPMQNVVSWNALIAGYAQHGHGEQALNFLGRMQSTHISPNLVTFVSILKACGSIGAAGKGQEIHFEIVKEGLLEVYIEVGNSLLYMYVKCGMFVEAQDVFDELPVRDDISWNTLIGGYAQHEYGEEAIEYFDQMQYEGYSPDVFTFACILKACGSIGASDKGQEIHAHILHDGFLETNVGIGTALVDMYAKCAMLAEAQDVFDDLPSPNVVTWTALIAGYAQHGYDKEALDRAEQMQHQNLSPDAFTFVSILKACSSIGATYKGQEIHAEIARHGLLAKKSVVVVVLIDMYAKCGSLAKAQEVFDRAFSRDVVSWTALISGYAQRGHGEQALKCFCQMECEGVFPNIATVMCILKACGSMGALGKGQEMHAEIVIKRLLEKDVGIASALIDMYAKCGSLARAREVFDVFPSQNRNEVMWNTLIAGYAQHEHAEEAFNCFEQMKHESLSPNAVTYTCILKACGNVGAVRKGQELHADIVRQGLLERHIVVANALIDMYAKSGMLAEAHNTFDKLPTRDVVSWNVLVAGYSQQGHGEEALKCYEQMQGEDFSLDVFSVSCILKACGSLGAAYKGQQIHATIARDGLLETDIVIETALVDMYCRCSMLAEAREVFKEIQGWNIAAWNAMMAGYTQVGSDKVVFNSFDKIIEESKDPDLITFSLVLNACTNSGLLDHGQMCFETMHRRFGIIPTLEHHTCMADLFCRAGRLDKAVVVIEEMPFLVNLTAWHTILGACQNWKNIKLGKWAFENAAELDQRDVASYVCMSNICADAGRQILSYEIEK